VKENSLNGLISSE